MSSLSSYSTKVTGKVTTTVTVNNANFTTANGSTVTNGSQDSILTTTGVTNWTLSNLGGGVRILNNLDLSNNASPSAYDASANGTTGFIKTVLYVTVSSTDGITTATQNVTFSSTGTYTISACIAPRNSQNTAVPVYFNTLSFSILMGGTALTLTGAPSYADGPTNTRANFTTGTAYTRSQSFSRISATYTAVSTGSVALGLRWWNTANNDSSIMVTGITIIKN